MVKQIEIYNNGKLDSICKYFYESGILKQSINYNEGKKSGKSFSYYDTGILKELLTYKNDILNGEFSTFYPNDVLKETGQTLMVFLMVNSEFFLNQENLNQFMLLIME